MKMDYTKILINENLAPIWGLGALRRLIFNGDIDKNIKFFASVSWLAVWPTRAQTIKDGLERRQDSFPTTWEEGRNKALEIDCPRPEGTGDNPATRDFLQESTTTIDSILENVLYVSDPYLGMIIVAMLFIILSIYLFTIIVVNFTNSELFVIVGKKFKNQYIQIYFNFLDKIRGKLLIGVIILCYLSLFSSLIFMSLVISYYPPFS
jgi:hypothetical protein